MQPSPETTLAIIIGASEFPKSPSLNPNPAFRRSASDFRSYLLSKDGFGLPERNLLDLFDSTKAAESQDEDIGSFLQGRIKELNESKVPAGDLILYYVGHGGFFSPGDQYFLALRGTKDGSENISGYPIHSLSNTIKENAASLRRYVILDCCFSAAAYESFQSGPLTVAKEKAQEEFPGKGTALLCASGPRDPAKAPADLSRTMFSEVLIDILEKGSTDFPEKLSLSELGRKAQDLIKERFPDKAVRPQVLSPDQTLGDIATLPIFPNPGLGVKTLGILRGAFSAGLPARPRLIGRETEIEDFTRLLREPDIRLLTLTGPSGVGKTALAKYLAATLEQDFRDGAFVVELSSLSDPELLLEEIGNAMPDYKQTVRVPMINFLSGKQRLIVLDNFETIISAAPFVTAIIEKCTGIKILATSHQPLSTGDRKLFDWEKRRPVPNLQYAEAGDQQQAASPTDYPAVKLFIDRAEAIKSPLDLSQEDVEAITAICREVNGLPLCIQIVASFISTYDPPQLLEFLRESGFAELDQDKLLSGAIEVRYANLEPAEQALFRRFAVFAGPCLLDAVRQVCESVGNKSVAVFSTLPRLVDRCFIQSEGRRYYMLQVIRDEALKRLEASGEADSLRAQYARFYVAYAKSVEPLLKTPDRAEHLYRLQQDYDNFRAVFDWSAGPGGDLELGLSLAGSLFWYWNHMGYFREGRRQTQRMLNQAATLAASEALASALYCDGGLAFLLGDYRASRAQLTKSVQVWRTVGNQNGLAYALIILGMVEKEIGEDLVAARNHEEESVGLLENRDPWGYALAINDLGNVLSAQGEEQYDEARRRYEASRKEWDKIGDSWGLSLVLSNLSSLECKEGHYDAAYDLMQDALKIQRESNDRWGHAWSLKGIGEAKLGLKDYRGAASYFYKSFCLHSELGRTQLVAECLEGLAKVAARLGSPKYGAYFVGAAEKLRDQSGSGMSSTKDKGFERLLAELQSQMTRRSFDQARERGRAMNEQQLLQQVKSFFSECNET